MGRTTFRAAAVLLALACVWAGILVYRAPAAPQVEERARPKWEYKVINEVQIGQLGQQANAAGGTGAVRDVLTAGLNSLGADGWELATVTSTQAPAIYHFKRPK
jgi:hypothetical protein